MATSKSPAFKNVKIFLLRNLSESEVLIVSVSVLHLKVIQSCVRFSGVSVSGSVYFK